MHIAVFSDYTFHSLGGIQTSLRAQCYELLQQGHQVTFVCPQPRTQTKGLNGLQLIGIPPVPFLLKGYEFVLPTNGATRRVVGQLQRLAPIDIVHCHTNMGVGIMAITVARKLNVPVVQTFHGREDIIAEKNTTLPRLTAWFFSSLHGLFMRHTVTDPAQGSCMSRKAWSIMLTHAQKANHIIVPSRHFLAVFREHGYAGPATVVPNGIEDAVVYRLASTKSALPAKPSVVWVGRLWPEKQPELFVQAAASLPQYDFVMCGDGILRAKIEKTMPKNLSLYTDRDQMSVLQTMKAATLFVHTSQNFDTQSMVLLEAIAAELPVIMMDENLRETVPAPGSVVVDGRAPALAAKIGELIADSNHLDIMRKHLRSLQPTILQSHRTREAITVYTRVIHEAKKHSRA